LTVLRPIPLTVEARQQVNTKLVSSVLGQLMKTLVADPVVATFVAETDFELLSGTVEERRTTKVLLDQNTVRTNSCLNTALPDAD